MNNLCLVGKRYDDVILFVDEVKNGETNSCTNIIKRVGGINNFLEIDLSPWKTVLTYSGTKKAYIVSNKSSSQRTSYVLGELDSTLPPESIRIINLNSNWTHISYIDDLECYSEVANFKMDFSLDFCTDKPRDPYVDLMKKAKVIFDSRERKFLYEKILIDTPIIFHDEYGIEIVKQGLVLFSDEIVPLPNLNVNGAGDMFAGYFIKNYISMDLESAASNAMVQTTNTLKNRRDNE